MSKELLNQAFSADQADSLVGWHQLATDDTLLTLNAAYAYVGGRGAEYIITDNDSSPTHSVEGFKRAKRLSLTFEITDDEAELQSFGFGGTNFWSEDRKTFQIPESLVGGDDVEWFTDHTQLMPLIRDQVDGLGLSNGSNTYASMYYYLNSLKLHQSLAVGFRTMGTMGTAEPTDRAFTDPDMATTTQEQIGLTKDVIAQTEAIKMLYEKFSVAAIENLGSLEGVEGMIEELVEQAIAGEMKAFTAAGQLVVPGMVYLGYDGLDRHKREPEFLMTKKLMDIQTQLFNLFGRSASSLDVQAVLLKQVETLGGKITFARMGLDSLVALHRLEEAV